MAKKLSGQSTNCPDNVESVRIIQKLSGQPKNCPDNPETVQIIQKLSGQLKNCPDNSKTFRTIQKLSGNSQTVRTIKKLSKQSKNCYNLQQFCDFFQVLRAFVAKSSMSRFTHFIRKVFVKILLSGKFLLFLTLVTAPIIFFRRTKTQSYKETKLQSYRMWGFHPYILTLLVLIQVHG